MGLHRAGFDVVCVDIEPQSNNPFPFFRADALDLLRLLLAGGGFEAGDRYWRLKDFTLIHASPPCQGDSTMSKSWNGKADKWPKLIPPTRELLEKTGLPYTIENVIGADLRDPIRLCGSMFDLPVERHRKFESNLALTAPACNHARQRELWPEGFPPLRSDRPDKRARVVGVYGSGGGDAKDIERWKWAMGIDWMKTKHELAESLPPAYMDYLGRQVLALLA